MRSLSSLLLFIVCLPCLASDDLSQLVERLKAKATFVISTKADFIHAINTCEEGDILYVKGEVEINLTGMKDIAIKQGVKIIGDRVTNKNLGALIYTDDAGVFPFFKVVGDDVLIAGLRIRGNDGKIFWGTNSFEGKSQDSIKKNYLKYFYENMTGSPVSIGIYTTEPNTTVFNCELFQWTNAAVYIQKGAINAKVYNCSIHHNQRFGLGYGVVVNGGEVNIEGNFFKSNGHCIASNGVKGSSYIARNNTFEISERNHWAVDVHGGADRKDGTHLAGRYFLVEDNLFIIQNSSVAIVARGVPEEVFLIRNNRILYVDSSKGKATVAKAFEQRNAKGNFVVEDNNVLIKEL